MAKYTMFPLAPNQPVGYTHALARARAHTHTHTHTYTHTHTHAPARAHQPKTRFLNMYVLLAMSYEYVLSLPLRTSFVLIRSKYIKGQKESIF